METRHCPGCGAELKPGAHFCEMCGKALEAEETVPPETAAQSDPAGDGLNGRKPATIEELRRYCAVRGMPLEKMRFFIGEDYQQPKAFGIYAEDGSFVVYKNKADGSRSVRYHGPDEAYAVNQLYQKLLSECHLRGIYPENYGQPGGMRNRGATDAGTNAGSRSFGKSRVNYGRSRERRTASNGLLVVFVIVALLGLIFSGIAHSKDGYYKKGNHYYYRDGTRWYMDDLGWSVVNLADDFIDSAYFVGNGYSSSWEISDVRDSVAWEQNHRSNDSDRNSWGNDWDTDWDDWGDFDTDWDSDW